jgi:CheY-like chemotaxis protein
LEGKLQTPLKLFILNQTIMQGIYIESFSLPNMSALPLLESSTDPEQLTAAAAAVVDEQPLVLIYSQEAETRYLYRTLLEMWNYRAIEAESFEESISISENRKPDLFLMDTNISLIDNLKMMRRLRERKTFDEMPFILLSGHSQTHVRQMAMDLGANDFLVKPVNFDVLETSLKKNIGIVFKNNI